ncbi:MAG: hypothetical protein P1U81_11250 [Verrucomicrobiales bacterium]|jgi:hypothetical protein|nr:hypothetical protein [Verrucomicrobiales bacterium]
MNNDFSILAQFLENLGPEVSGHSSNPLSEGQAELIQKFAQGTLTAAEREGLLPEILGNETALHELVSKLQAES